MFVRVNDVAQSAKPTLTGISNNSVKFAANENRTSLGFWDSFARSGICDHEPARANPSSVTQSNAGIAKNRNSASSRYDQEEPNRSASHCMNRGDPITITHSAISQRPTKRKAQNA